jgi:hypothetical protein
MWWLIFRLWPGAPPGRWRFAGTDWLPSTWFVAPILGWSVCTPEERDKYPRVAPAFFRLGPLDMDFRPCS